MREYPNPGYAPTRWPEGTTIRVRWANGNISKWSFTIDQLKWDRRGWDFDVHTFWKE